MEGPMFVMFPAPLAQDRAARPAGSTSVILPIDSLNMKIRSMTEIDPIQLRANPDLGLALFDSKQKEKTNEHRTNGRTAIYQC